jgi:hypothetical protein
MQLFLQVGRLHADSPRDPTAILGGSTTVDADVPGCQGRIVVWHFKWVSTSCPDNPPARQRNGQRLRVYKSMLYTTYSRLVVVVVF